MIRETGVWSSHLKVDPRMEFTNKVWIVRDARSVPKINVAELVEYSAKESTVAPQNKARYLHRHLRLIENEEWLLRCSPGNRYISWIMDLVLLSPKSKYPRLKYIRGFVDTNLDAKGQPIQCNSFFTCHVRKQKSY